MLRDDENRSHYSTVMYIRSLLDRAGMDLVRLNADLSARRIVADELIALDGANEAYIKAKGQFATASTDYTMRNLNGTWSRLNRIVIELDEKYGRRE